MKKIIQLFHLKYIFFIQFKVILKKYNVYKYFQI